MPNDAPDDEKTDVQEPDWEEIGRRELAVHADQWGNELSSDLHGIGSGTRNDTLTLQDVVRPASHLSEFFQNDGRTYCHIAHADPGATRLFYDYMNLGDIAGWAALELNGDDPLVDDALCRYTDYLRDYLGDIEELLEHHTEEYTEYVAELDPDDLQALQDGEHVHITTREGDHIRIAPREDDDNE